jgi:cytidylate kinase|tara:strand:+ start:1535 stop:2200 length:666 start_codon:yes stop_codon:yes gene_type:complete
MISFNELQEGVYDPNILKAFFMAGGPGSGKSYVVQRTTGGLGLKIVNSDEIFEKKLKAAGLSLKMPDNEQSMRDPIRDKSKVLTKKRKEGYLEGRLGLVIDGTGHDYEKIAYQARQLEELGYDTFMIFVNTSLDIALQRNAERKRSVPESIVIKSWNDVQKNIGKFQNYFRGNFVIVDNNSKDEDIMGMAIKRVRALARKKLQNGRGKAWIARELQLRKRQ